MSEFSKLSFWFLSKILKSTSLRISMHTEQWDVTCSLACHVGYACYLLKLKERGTAHPCSWANCHGLPGDFAPKTSLLHAQGDLTEPSPGTARHKLSGGKYLLKSLASQDSDFPKLKLLKLFILFETISSWFLAPHWISIGVTGWEKCWVQ